MSTYKVSNLIGVSTLRYFLLIIAGVIFLGTYVLIYLETGQILANNTIPQFENFHLLVLFFTITSTLLFTLSVINPGAPVAFQQKIKKTFVVFQGLSRLAISSGIVLWSTLGLSLASSVLFIISPATFSKLSNEDQIIEILSALFLFLAATNLVILYFDSRRTNKSNKLWAPGLLLLAAAFFVIAMEEVSWFQRSFGIHTPAILSQNRQGEMNLHNFASNTSEIIYYSASFLYLIVFPFVYDQIKALSQLKVIAFFAPSLTILFVSAPLVVFNYGLWNNPPMQIAFFATLAIILFYTWRSFTEPATPGWLRYYLISLCIFCVFAQFIFIWRGDTFLKSWEVTEYKEFFIPLSFYVYSLELIMREKGIISLKFIISTIGVGLIIMALRLLQFVNK